MKKFAMCPYHWKQKNSGAVQVCFSSAGSMECLGNQEVANVTHCYFALCEISTKKSETAMRTWPKIQLLPFCYVKEDTGHILG